MANDVICDPITGDTRKVPVAPGQIQQLVQVGLTLQAQGQVAGALHCFESTLELDPRCTPAWICLADLLVRDSQLQLALDCYLQALSIEPNNVVARVNLGNLLRQTGQHQDALSLLEPIAELPDVPPAVRYNLANTLADLGRFDEARRHYSLTIGRHQQPAKILFNLSQVMRFREADRPQLSTWADLARPAIDAIEDRIFWHFALGKAHDDLGEFDDAWGHFAAGNSLVATDFDPARQHTIVDRIIATFTPEFFAQRRGWGETVGAPVFIVGMPRSGTSLVEQIMAAHPDVHAAGEREEFGRMVADWAIAQCMGPDDAAAALSLTSTAVAGMAQRYAQRVFPAGRASRVTDKMPTNFLLLGWMALCFPNARVIHCRRDPRDVCLSCYFQHFTARLPFTYRLEHLAEYYRPYERLMDHWRKSLPLQICEVEYEHLVENTEAESRRLIDFCGLDWNDACLRGHEASRAVSTASQWQVRQPVYRTSRGRWRNYEQHLGPLIAAFGSE